MKVNDWENQKLEKWNKFSSQLNLHFEVIDEISVSLESRLESHKRKLLKSFSQNECCRVILIKQQKLQHELCSREIC